jgi:hypothetical protein
MIRETEEAIIARFVDMVAVIPDFTDDGGLSMAAEILSASEPGDLDSRWDDRAEDALVGVEQIIYELEKAPSTIAENKLPFYLIVYAADRKSGERIRWTTSSLAIISQLIKASVAEWLPLAAKVVVGDRTAKGFYPKHLQILDA